MRYADFPERNHGIDTMSGLNTIVLRNMTPFKLRKKGKKKEEDKMSLRNLSISMRISIAWSLSLQFIWSLKKTPNYKKLMHDRWFNTKNYQNYYHNNNILYNLKTKFLLQLFYDKKCCCFNIILVLFLWGFLWRRGTCCWRVSCFLV